MGLIPSSALTITSYVTGSIGGASVRQVRAPAAESERGRWRIQAKESEAVPGGAGDDLGDAREAGVELALVLAVPGAVSGGEERAAWGPGGAVETSRPMSPERALTRIPSQHTSRVKGYLRLSSSTSRPPSKSTATLAYGAGEILAHLDGHAVTAYVKVQPPAGKRRCRWHRLAWRRRGEPGRPQQGEPQRAARDELPVLARGCGADRGSPEALTSTS